MCIWPLNHNHLGELKRWYGDAALIPGLLKSYWTNILNPAFSESLIWQNHCPLTTVAHSFFLSLKVTPKLSYAPKTIISKQAKPKSNGSVRVRKNLLIRGWIKERRKITPKHGIWAYYIGSYDRDQSNFVAFNVALVVACLYSSRRLDGAVWFRSYHVFFVSN